MLSNREFVVCVDYKISRKCKINNDLSQGLFLTHVLFNLHNSDLPNTASKFQFQTYKIYVDDTCVAFKKKQLKDYEITLNDDLKTLDAYFKQRRIGPKSNKAESSLFNFNNKSANRSLNTNFCGHNVKHAHLLKYLVVTLDGTLTCKYT